MRLITILYFLLLAYVIAALVFWGHSLNKQSAIIYEHEVRELERRSLILNVNYQENLEEIQQRYNMRKAQYIGEGATFLIIILIGASIVYSSVRGNDKVSKQQHNFILSITHELKSPIAAIKLNLETMNRRALSPDLQNKLLNSSLKEADRLDDLSSNLLLASRFENKSFTANYEKVNISKVLEESVKLYQNRHDNEFITHIEEECFCLSDQFMWKLAINNLLENAIKYSPKNKAIEVTLYTKDQVINLYIADQGIGIDDEEKKKIFKQFYRVGSEISRTTKGTGLGLYLTSKIIEEFNGSIMVRNNMPTGTIFEINVPEYHSSYNA
ncbi:MAG TPA: HAMP domain-containing sensor histidine kinase [Chitinophagaceae bacterium]|nr:HAMP domain-containing sensor histidine kinase [Chitinophagaceae bacterium]